MSTVTTATSTVDLTKIKPYGDTYNDGKVQMSFTLPVPDGEEAQEAARQYAKLMGMDEPSVTHHSDLGIGYTFFVVYGPVHHTVDYTKIHVTKVESDVFDRVECGEWIAKNIGRTITMVGASTGSDAHTVGIDAIMNMKGFHGHFGLERFKNVNAINMGSQVPNEELIAKAIELKGIRDRMLLLCGGPRISHELAQELGFDAGFGPETYAEHVCSYVMQEIVARGWVNKK